MSVFSPKLKQQLLTQLQTLLIDSELFLSEQAQQKAIQHLELLAQWNTVYNLTAVKDPFQMLVKHLVDSLMIAPYLTGKCFIDVGTGAGFPGIPLALALPKTHWTLLDSNGKKIRFLFQVKAQLKLENVEIIHDRVENFMSAQPFDGVVVRAWTDLGSMVDKTRHLLSEQGHVWAMKGVFPEQELKALQLPVKLFRLNIPPDFGESKRHLVCIPKGPNKLGHLKT